MRHDLCTEITKEWIDQVQDAYLKIDAVLDGRHSGFKDDRGQPLRWHEERSDMEFIDMRIRQVTVQYRTVQYSRYDTNFDTKTMRLYESRRGKCHIYYTRNKKL